METFVLNQVHFQSLAAASRKMLDEGGLHHLKIFASSGLDECKVQALVASGAPIDAFGVGAKLAVMADAPEPDMAYRLVEYGGKGRITAAPGSRAGQTTGTAAQPHASR